MLGPDPSNNKYTKGTVIAFAYSLAAGLGLWSLGVAVPITYIVVSLIYAAFALHIVLATSVHGSGRTVRSIGVVLLFCAILFAGLWGTFHELMQHGVRGGFVLRWVS